MALVAAVELHAAVVLVARWERLAPVVAAAPHGEGAAAADDEAWVAVEIAAVTGDGERVVGEPLLPVWGAGDRVGYDEVHPLPGAEADLPGRVAASRGGGDAGGSATWTGRDDGDELRALPWSGEDGYRIARTRTGDDRTTPRSALVARPERGFDDRDGRDGPVARAGHRGATSGAGTGAPVAGGVTEDDAPADGTLPATPGPARTGGAVAPGAAAPLADDGVASVDAPRRGAAGDDVDSAAISDERHPGAFDLTEPRAGGPADGTGVRGREVASGLLAGGRGRGTAALRAAVAAGVGVNATVAHRHDPYFRAMYRKVDERVEYPRELALSLDQGEVIVVFTLLADGSVAEMQIEKSSGFAAFDYEVTEAIRVAAPFGPVPASLLGEGDRVRVRAPYAFRNPWIR